MMTSEEIAVLAEKAAQEYDLDTAIVLFTLAAAKKSNTAFELAGIAAMFSKQIIYAAEYQDWILGRNPL